MNTASQSWNLEASLEPVRRFQQPKWIMAILRPLTIETSSFGMGWPKSFTAAGGGVGWLCLNTVHTGRRYGGRVATRAVKY